MVSARLLPTVAGVEKPAEKPAGEPADAADEIEEADMVEEVAKAASAA
jgi:hypothetical protein